MIIWGIFEFEEVTAGAGPERTPVDDFDPVAFCSGRLGIVPDAAQTAMLRGEAKRGILNCSRQWGKSAVKAVHRAWTRAGSLVLIASPTERQSAGLLRKAKEMVRQLGIAPRGDGENAHSLMLPNGSADCGAANGGDGERISAVDLLLIDEASRVQDVLYKSLRPMLLISDGDLWMMSTPYGKRGFFYETWERGGGQWHRVRVAAQQNPRYGRTSWKMSGKKWRAVVPAGV